MNCCVLEINYQLISHKIKFMKDIFIVSATNILSLNYDKLCTMKQNFKMSYNSEVSHIDFDHEKRPMENVWGGCLAAVTFLVIIYTLQHFHQLHLHC